MKNHTLLASSLTLSTALLCQVSFAEMKGATEDKYLSCEDIEFSSLMTEKYADIEKACLDVVEKDGRKFAEVKIEVTRVMGNRVSFKFINEDGTGSDIHSSTLPTSFRAKIDGENVRARELAKGQELNIYLPSDRWAILNIADDIPDEDLYIEMAAYETLPDTASPLPLYGLLGMLLLSIGTALGFVRRSHL